MGTGWHPSLRRGVEAPSHGDRLIEVDRKGDQGFPSVGDGGTRAYRNSVKSQMSCAGDELLSYDAGILQSKTGGVFMVIKAFSSETIASWSSRIEACAADVRRM